MRTIHLTLSVLFASSALVDCVVEDETASTTDLATEVTRPKRFAPDQASSDDNWALWQKYCVGDREVTKRPTPNYQNDEVKAAATKLSQVAEHSFALYGDIKAHHKTTVPSDLQGTVTQSAHDFLGYLCAEFRDRATMVEAKVRWVAGMNYLNNENADAYDPAGDPWQQMKQDDYHPYLEISSALWNARQAKLSEDGKRYMQVGNLSNVDTPVPGTTVCETKYMFAEYIKKGRGFDTLEAFNQGYAAFRDASCTLPDDEDYYYDFRGDSNIKPNSPESNGMIWFSRTVTRQCDARASAAPYQQARSESNVPASVCKQYFAYPFTSRWNAARAGLATWVLVDPDAGGLDSNSTFTVFPKGADQSLSFGDKGPFRATNASGPVTLLDGYVWRYGAMGLPEMHHNDKEKIHKLLQQAVDRHTDWYNSGYDDEMQYKRLSMSQAYSPFVASSYEMSESDNFVTPGTTVPVIDPSSREHKHFMFVFRIHKDNWYTPERINAEDTPVPNFDRYWFDETSFGETGLANGEKAWDRLGTALESELDTILYLHNLPAY